MAMEGIDRVKVSAGCRRPASRRTLGVRRGGV